MTFAGASDVRRGSSAQGAAAVYPFGTRARRKALADTRSGDIVEASRASICSPQDLSFVSIASLLAVAIALHIAFPLAHGLRDVLAQLAFNPS